MKHLKIRAEYRPATKDVELTLLEQTHFGNDFGRLEDAFNTSLKDACVFKHKDIAIYSSGFYNHGPQYFFNGKYPNTIEKITTWFCVGASSSKSERTKVENTVPIDEWPALKAAIEAYNEWGANQ
jgi:hypothetical protein